MRSCQRPLLASLHIGAMTHGVAGRTRTHHVRCLAVCVAVCACVWLCEQQCVPVDECVPRVTWVFYLPVGSIPDDHDNFAAPVRLGAGTLHFAGEATDGEYMGSVHAAYLSGERAAQEILAGVDGDSGGGGGGSGPGAGSGAGAGAGAGAGGDTSGGGDGGGDTSARAGTDGGANDSFMAAL